MPRKDWNGLPKELQLLVLQQCCNHQFELYHERLARRQKALTLLDVEHAEAQLAELKGTQSTSVEQFYDYSKFIFWQSKYQVALTEWIPFREEGDVLSLNRIDHFNPHVVQVHKFEQYVGWLRQRAMQHPGGEIPLEELSPHCPAYCPPGLFCPLQIVDKVNTSTTPRARAIPGGSMRSRDDIRNRARQFVIRTQLPEMALANKSLHDLVLPELFRRTLYFRLSTRPLTEQRNVRRNLALYPILDDFRRWRTLSFVTPFAPFIREARLGLWLELVWKDDICPYEWHEFDDVAEVLPPPFRICISGDEGTQIELHATQLLRRGDQYAVRDVVESCWKSAGQAGIFDGRNILDAVESIMSVLEPQCRLKVHMDAEQITAGRTPALEIKESMMLLVAIGVGKTKTETRADALH